MPGFLELPTAAAAARGPAGRLLYDPARIDPAAWLTERLGEVTVQPGTEPPAARPATDREAHAQASAEAAAATEPAEPEPSVADDAPPEPAVQTVLRPRLRPDADANGSCSGPTTGLCGTAAARSGPAWTWCPEHIQWSAPITSASRGRSRPRR